MKKHIRYTSFVLCLLSFFLSGSLSASHENAFSLDFTKELSNSASDLLCGTPTWPNTYNITQTSATFSWSAVAGAESYTVQTRIPNGTWYDLPSGNVYSTFVTVNGLSPNTSYQWRVRANCGNGETSAWTNAISFMTEGGGYCLAPDWLGTTNITQTTATFDWSSVSGAQSYSIQWRYAGGTWYNLNGGPFYNTWVNVGNLDPATSYEWRVKSNCSYGSMSDWSYPASFTTLGNYCSTPTWPSTSNITSNGATFNWSGSSGAQSYSVQIRLPNGTWSDVYGSPTSNTWISVNNLQPGTTYEWRVRANCGSGQYSNWTYPTSFTTSGGYSCYAPEWLDAINVGQTTATLDWEGVSGAQSYSIQWRLSGGTWYNLNGGPFYNTWVNIGGLDPGTTYEWRVRSNCANGVYSSWSYSDSFTTLGYSCSTPGWPSTSNITSNSATFNWSAVAGAESYSVQIRYPNGTWTYLSGSPFNNTWVTVTNLTPNTTYEWRVRANCSGGSYSNWTYPTTFTTGGYSCHAPDWLGTTNITSTSALLDWSSEPGAESYSVEYRIAGGSWYSVGGPVYDTWYTLTGLQPGTTYEWRVRSNCGGGVYSNWSYYASFTTLGYSCSTPTWPSTSNITSTSASFSWSAVSGAQSYSVEIRLPNGSWSPIYGSPFYNNYASVNNLTPGTTYEWRVRANCSGGQYSNWTNPVTFTTLAGYQCASPDWLGTSNITSSSALLDWSPVTGAQSYTVQYRIVGGTWYDVPGNPFTETWATLTGLQPSTSYEWRVRSNCSNGATSDWSYSGTFTTLGYQCSTPGWPSTSNITSTSATFNWSASSGAESYTVELRLPNGTWTEIPGNPFTTTWANVGNLTPNTTYEWRVRANCSNGQHSNWTYPTSFTTTGGVTCYAPDWLGTSNITQTSAVLDWSDESGAESYSVQYRLAGGTWYNVSGSPFNISTAVLSGLQPGTHYEWRVRSNCANGVYSNWSYYASFHTLGYSCSTPTWPSTSNITSSGATFSWSAVSGAENYTVQIRLANGTWENIPGGPVYGTSATVNNLLPNTTYEWRVRANCSGGQYSNWTSGIYFTTGGSGYCHAPDWLYTANITATTATFDWEPVSGAINYSIQWRFAGGTWYDLSGGPFSSTWVNVGNLQPGTAYEWRVRSNCSNWSTSPWSYPAAFTTQGYACGVPTWPSTSNITSHSAKLHWTGVSGAQSYTVQIRQGSGYWQNVSGGPFYDTWVTVSGLNPNTTYEWRVRANCGYSQYSDWTYPVSFTTSGGSYCTAPNWLYTSNITQNSATLDWNTVNEAVSYTVQWRLAGTQTWFTLMEGPFYNSYFHVNNLTPGTSYEWRVRSNCYGGNYSSWSYTASFTTQGYYCSTPTWPSTYNITQTTATVSWSASSGAESYTVQVRWPSGNWTNVSGGPFYNTSVTITGLSPGTTYEWRVRANCSGGQYSNWTVPVSFTTINSLLGDTPELFVGDENTTVVPDAIEEIEKDKMDEGFVTPDELDLRVSPNPANEFINIALLQTDECRVSGVSLVDLSGKRVFTKTYEVTEDEEFTDRIALDQLQPGMYVLQVATACGVMTEKVIVTR